MRHATYASFFFLFKKKFFSWYGWTGGLLKTLTHIVLTTILLQFYFIFFLAGTIDSLNRTRGKQNLHDWYVCFHVVIVINIEKSCWDLWHTRGKLYVCMRRFGLCFMSRTNKAVATRWLATTTTTTTKSCDQHLLYYHSTILFSPFPRAYKAKPTSCPEIQMMRFKFQGGTLTWSLLKLITSLSRRRWDDG